MASKDINFQTETRYEFQIAKIKDLNYNITSIALPSIRMSPPSTSTPFSNIRHQGDKLDFGELGVEAILSETHQDWYEIFLWITGASGATSFKDFRDLINNKSKNFDNEDAFVNINPFPASKGYTRIKSQGRITALDGQENPKIAYIFVNIFPVSLSLPSFDSKSSEINYMTYTVGFAYDYFYLENIL